VRQSTRPSLRLPLYSLPTRIGSLGSPELAEQVRPYVIAERPGREPVCPVKGCNARCRAHEAVQAAESVDGGVDCGVPSPHWLGLPLSIGSDRRRLTAAGRSIPTTRQSISLNALIRAEPRPPTAPVTITLQLGSGVGDGTVGTVPPSCGNNGVVNLDGASTGQGRATNPG
jgi:hypothetical protein